MSSSTSSSSSFNEEQTPRPRNAPRTLDVYKVLREHRSSTSDIIEWHFLSIIESIRRKLTLRQLFNDPFTVKLATVIYKEVFYQAYRAIRDVHTTFGTYCEAEKKNRKVKGYTIKFTHISALRYHLKQLTNLDNVDSYFLKTFPNGEKATLKVTEDQPASFDYKISTSTLLIRIKYSVVNKHGIECTI